MLDYEKEKEKQAFRSMTSRQKREHIWEYYRMPIVLGIIALIVVGWAVNHYIINPPKHASVNITFHTFQTDADLQDALQDQLNEEFPEYVDKRHQIEVITVSTGLDAIGSGDEYAAFTKMIALIETKSIDLLVGDRSAMESDGYYGYFMPLEDVFTEEELDQLEALGFTFVDVRPSDVDDQGYTYLLDPVLVLVDVSSNETLRSINNQQETLIGFAANTKHLEEAKTLFWYFITGEKPAVSG